MLFMSFSKRTTFVSFFGGADDPEPGPMLFNQLVLNAANHLRKNILEVAGDIQSEASYKKLEAQIKERKQLGLNESTFEWVEGEESECDVPPGNVTKCGVEFGYGNAGCSHKDNV